MTIDATNSTSRRGLLAGLIGGLAATLAGSLGRPAAVRAADPNDVVMGAPNSYSGNVTGITNTATNGNAFAGIASGYGTAVDGTSPSGLAVYGTSGSGTLPAVFGWSYNGNTGVMGFSGFNVPASPAKTGVYGYAAQDSDARGVTGESTAGRGVYGIATSGAGIFGQSTAGWGVYASSTSGTGVYASSDSGTGVDASSSTGFALSASGRVAFSTAGLTSVAVGTKSKTVTSGTDLVAGSKILCALESNQAGLLIQRLTKDIAANTFKVFLSANVLSGKYAKVAWFVIG